MGAILVRMTTINRRLRTLKALESRKISDDRLKAHYAYGRAFHHVPIADEHGKADHEPHVHVQPNDDMRHTLVI